MRPLQQVCERRGRVDPLHSRLHGAALVLSILQSNSPDEINDGPSAVIVSRLPSIVPEVSELLPQINRALVHYGAVLARALKEGLI